ncbi:MAG: KpsF/GutQ family sugar-phosphate isomerase [Gemmataceae bacterium]|nr:KpsF/GutQ family sugar-phosphate isomerase [Gemmataceae bacterium]
MPPLDRVAFARRVLRAEAAAVEAAAGRLDTSFDRLVDLLLGCRGRVAVAGVGKSADVGQKIVGTLNSTGTRAYTLDPTRAVHGDLGMVHPDDVALLLSHSGESDELVRLLGPLRRAASAVAAVTGNAQGTLARAADVAVVYGPVSEACPLALAPSSSTTVMLALGDAVAFTLLELRRFTADDFARFHPAGTLGRKLATVAEVMRTGDDLRIAQAAETVREVFARGRHPGRRTGAVMLVDAAGRLAGLFTDSDLARLIEARRDAALDEPVGRVMTKTPTVIGPAARVAEALDLIRDRKISELPVVDADGRPVGLLDITDLIGLAPAAADPRPALRLADRRSA